VVHQGFAELRSGGLIMRGFMTVTKSGAILSTLFVGVEKRVRVYLAAARKIKIISYHHDGLRSQPIRYAGVLGISMNWTA
jgi:hypothetical protein